MMLNKRERNKIYQRIVDSGLDTTEFDLEDTDDKVIIDHNSGSTFEFSRKEELDKETLLLDQLSGSVPNPPPITIYYSVKARVTDGINDVYRATNVDYITIVKLPEWLREIKATVGVPDYWAEMKRSRASIAIIQSGNFPNTPFTLDEQTQIVAQLREVKKQVEQLYGLSSEQMTQVNEKLDEVAEVSKHLGRKDWVVIFAGTIFNLVVADTVTPGVAQHIFIMTLQVLVHLFTGGSIPPQIPPHTIA